MVTARNEKCGKVFSNLWNDMKRKMCTVLIAFVISLVPLILLLLNNSVDSLFTCSLIDKLFNVNLSILGVDIAALAILFALFQGEKLDEKAKEAFTEQSISFISNAILQLLALILAIVYFIFHSSNCIFIFCTVIQICAVLLVFDIIIELYTIVTAITNR